MLDVARATWKDEKLDTETAVLCYDPRSSRTTSPDRFNPVSWVLHAQDSMYQSHAGAHTEQLHLHVSFRTDVFPSANFIHGIKSIDKLKKKKKTSVIATYISYGVYNQSILESASNPIVDRYQTSQRGN